MNRFTLRPTGKVGESGEAVQARLVPPAVRMIRKDPYGALVTALEVFDPATQAAQPGGLLVARQIEPRPQILGADNAADALSIVLDQRGVVDLDAIAALTGQTVAEARRELGDGIWQDPVSQRVADPGGVPVRGCPGQTRPGPPGRGRRSGPVGRTRDRPRAGHPRRRRAR